jgi:hypothetical protein
MRQLYDTMADDFEELALLSLILLCEEEDENKPFRELLLTAFPKEGTEAAKSEACLYNQ